MSPCRWLWGRSQTTSSSKRKAAPVLNTLLKKWNKGNPSWHSGQNLLKGYIFFWGKKSISCLARKAKRISKMCLSENRLMNKSYIRSMWLKLPWMPCSTGEAKIDQWGEFRTWNRYYTSIFPFTVDFMKNLFVLISNKALNLGQFGKSSAISLLFVIGYSTLISVRVVS